MGKQTSLVLWTQPINHDILSGSFIGILLGLVLVVQNNTIKCHEAKLFQYVIEYFPIRGIFGHFARGSVGRWLWPLAY
jgi:hypothetical protein